MPKLHWNPREWFYAEVILIMAGPGILYFVFILIDILPARDFVVLGKVISEKESWTLKQQYRCNFVIKSETVGLIEKFYYGRCHDAFVPGQTVIVHGGIGIITGQVIADTIQDVDSKP